MIAIWNLWLQFETFLMQAFPPGETAASAAISRKYQVDAAIMSTIILDLQPFNQVNRWKTSFRWQVRLINYCRAGFQSLVGVLDPSFTLSSDAYYRGLLAKVLMMRNLLPVLHWNVQIYTKGKAKIKQFIDEEKPEFVSLSLDGWSVHHHGYMGSIASRCWNKRDMKC